MISFWFSILGAVLCTALAALVVTLCVWAIVTIVRYIREG